MGEVYKGRDVRLDRIIALKVLSAGVASEPEFRHRLDQEARAISSLDHPNICALYDVGHQNGVDFLVMQYLEGETLADRLTKGPLAVDAALDYAIDIADALDRAHRQGIIHRDLKPSNVMLTKSGIKLLDFGLAKTTRPRSTLQDVTQMSRLTAVGSLLGTLHYMSPEQLEGREVDTRSDIFAFGAVLYELLTAEAPFKGTTPASIIAAILQTEPAPLTTRNSTVPSPLERVVRRCLAKDPERRFQHIGDVRLALQDVKEDLNSGAAAVSSETTQLAPRTRLLHIGILAALAALIGAAAWWYARPEPIDVMSAMARVTSDSGLTWEPALSPDGKLLAYSSDRGGNGATGLDIWVQQVAGGEPIRVTQDPADDREPAFSPDGSRIAFWSDREGGGIYVVPALGGEARLIAQGGQTPNFSPDGQSIVYWVGNRTTGDPAAPNSAQAFVVPATGGTPRPFHPEFSVVRYPTWASDGKHLLFWGKRDPNLTEPNAVDWWVATLDNETPIQTGAEAILAAHGMETPIAPGTWIADGSVIFAARQGDTTDLWRVRVDPSRGRVTGPPIRVTAGTGASEQPSAVVGADDKRGSVTHVVFSGLARNTQIWSLPLNADRGEVTGPLRRLTDGPAAAEHGSISADERSLVFTRARAGDDDVWLKDLKSGHEVDLTPTPERQFHPSLNSDGSRVAYSQTKDGKTSIYTLTIGSSPFARPRPAIPEKLCDNCRWVWQWSMNAQQLLFVPGSSGRPEVSIATLATGEKTKLLTHPQFNLYQANFSPDAKSIALVAHVDSQHSRLFIAPFRSDPGPTNPETDWVPISSGEFWDDKPRWSPDGKTLYFISNRDGFLCLWAQRLVPETRRPAGPPFEVFHFHNAGRSMLNVNLAVLEPSLVRDQILLNLGEITGNIWRGEVQR